MRSNLGVKAFASGLYENVTVDVADQVYSILPQVYFSAANYLTECGKNVVISYYHDYLIFCALFIKRFFGFNQSQLIIGELDNFYSIWRLRMGKSKDAFRKTMVKFKLEFNRSDSTIINSFAAQLLLYRLNNFWTHLKPFFKFNEIPFKNAILQTIVFSSIVAPFIDVKYVRFNFQNLSNLAAYLVQTQPQSAKYQPYVLVDTALKVLPTCIETRIDRETLYADIITSFNLS